MVAQIKFWRTNSLVWWVYVLKDANRAYGETRREKQERASTMLSEATTKALTLTESDIPNNMMRKQTARLADRFVTTARGHVLRMEFLLDSSYIGQSRMAVSIFSVETKKWNELLTLMPGIDFDVSLNASRSSEPEANLILVSSYSPSREKAAPSWSSVYRLMYEKAEELLNMIDLAPQDSFLVRQVN